MKLNSLRCITGIYSGTVAKSGNGFLRGGVAAAYISTLF